MHTFTTDLSVEQVKRLIREIAEVLGLSTFPLNDHAYQPRESMAVIAEISPSQRRSGAMHAWIVGYQEVSRTTARVMVFPHEWAGFDIGTQAIYDIFVDQLRAAVEVTAVTPLPPATPTVQDDRPVETPTGATLYCNQWLIDQYFNQGNTNYRALVDQWLEIRTNQDYRDSPAKPIDSMRTVIYEERKRRGHEDA